MNNDSIAILPFKEEKVEVFMTAQEEVYKSALEIILSLCDSYSTTTSEIKSVCETVLKTKKGNKDE